MSYRDPSPNGIHALPRRADVTVTAPPRLALPVTGPKRSRIRPVTWLVLGVLWLILIWQAWHAGYDYASQSIEQRGGMSPETYRQNLERGKEILDGMRSGTSGP